MKKKVIKTVAGLLAVLLGACHQGRRTVIAERSNNRSLEIEYHGYAFFNREGTAIERITSGGQVKFTKNGERFIAEPDAEGRVLYSFNGGDKVMRPAGHEREFLADAVKEMLKRGHYDR